MNYSTKEIVKTLKAARESKGLSQRDLSMKSGVPQSHISKIEKGLVDLRVSSLIALARDLGLELMLIPSKTIPAVNSIVRSNERGTAKSSHETRIANRELKKIQDSISIIPKTKFPSTKLEKLQRQIYEMQNFNIEGRELGELKAISKQIHKFQGSTKNLKVFEEILSHADKLRNALAHSALNMPTLDYPRSAYSLEGNDND